MAKAKAKPAPEPEEDDDDDDDVEVAPRKWLGWLRRGAWIRRGAYIATTLLFGTGTAGWYVPDIPVAGPLAQQVRARLWTSSKAAPKKADAKASAAKDGQDKKAIADKTPGKRGAKSDPLDPSAATSSGLADVPAALPDSPIADDAADTGASHSMSQPTAPTFEEEPAVAATEPTASSAAPPTIEPDVDPSLSAALSDTSSSAEASTPDATEESSAQPDSAATAASATASAGAGSARRSRWSRSAPEATEAAAPVSAVPAPEQTSPPTAPRSASTSARDYESSTPEGTAPARVQPLMGQGRVAALPASPPTAPPTSAAAPMSRAAVASPPSSPASREPMTRATSAPAAPAMGPRAVSNQPAAARQDETVSIATFNIQVFGTAKLDNPDVTDKLVEIIRQFDVVAIQEIRSKEDDILPRFVRLINSTGRQYDFVIGPRLGRTSSKEQYAFIYDAQRIEVNRPSVGTIEDPSDLLHREPLIARFRSRLVPPDRAFTFYLANIHTDPDEVETEVDVLADVFEVMQHTPSGEDDIILLGDFNTDHRRLGRLGERSNLFAVVEDTPTNARQNEAYDNILFDRQATSEFTGRWAVLDVQSWFRISREEMLSISDHLPVWATFSAWESTSPASMTSRGSGTAASGPSARRSR